MSPETAALLLNVAYSIITAAVALLLNKLLSRAISRFADRTRLERHTAKPIIRTVNIVICVIAILALLGIWGLKAPLTGLLAGAGVTGIILGFAMKDVFSDLIGGVMLFFDKPFKIGNSISVENVSGEVTDIGIRSTKIRSFDGKFVTIPNSKMAQSVIINVSTFRDTRLAVDVGVDYDTDLEKARKAITRAVDAMQKRGIINKEPAPSVAVAEFGASSINFRVLLWYNPSEVQAFDARTMDVKGEFMIALKKEFDRAGITIPFTQVAVSERKKG